MKTPRQGTLLRLLASAASASLLSIAALANPQPTTRSEEAHATIERFLLGQTADLPGTVVIRIDSVPLGLLPACETLEPFLPSGARLWGRASVGLRCTASQPWTRYVPVYIAVMGRYYVAARQIDFGEALTSADVAMREADLTNLPASVIVDAAQFEGMSAANRIALGTPIRKELLRGSILVQQGQNVKVISRGSGFVISTEGKALTNAALGAIIQVKTQGGQLIRGKVAASGIIERSD